MQAPFPKHQKMQVPSAGGFLLPKQSEFFSPTLSPSPQQDESSVCVLSGH